MTKKTKIELYCNMELDDIAYNLRNQLSTKELIDFAISLGSNLTDEENFYNGLKNRFEKIKYDKRTRN